MNTSGDSGTFGSQKTMNSIKRMQNQPIKDQIARQDNFRKANAAKVNAKANPKVKEMITGKKESLASRMNKFIGR